MSASKVYDRQVSFLGGMNSFLNPIDLPTNQAQLLTNMIVLENGRVVTRPGADKLGTTPDGAVPVKGLGFLNNYTNGKSLIMAKDASLYSYNGTAWSTINLAGKTWNPAGLVAMCQGVDTMLMSDGTNGMLAWNGSTLTQLTTGITNAPFGVTSIAYMAGMFLVSGPAMVQNGTVYPADTIFYSDYLNYTDTKWTGTNNIRVGSGDGDPIVALAPLQSVSSVPPSYNLAVLKQNSVWLLTWNPSYSGNAGQTSSPNWAAAPQGEQVGFSKGCVGANAWCVYQNDLLYMSPDGVQSLQRMQASSGQYQVGTPLSLPIQNYIDRINWAYADKICAVKYRNYAVFFVPLDNSTTNNYALVWDGIIGQWMVWTNWNVTAVCVTRFPALQGVQNSVQLILGDTSGNANFWKDAKSLAQSDSTYFDNGVSIPWSVNTRSMVFGNLDFQKKASAVQVRFNAGNCVANLSAYMDLADQDDWNYQIPTGGVTLPVTLPFTLASVSPSRIYRTLEGLPYFNEIYVSIGANTGWADIRNVVVSAYMKPFKNPLA